LSLISTSSILQLKNNPCVQKNEQSKKTRLQKLNGQEKQLPFNDAVQIEQGFLNPDPITAGC
jgi:hypothetical protein